MVPHRGLCWSSEIRWVILTLLSILYMQVATGHDFPDNLLVSDEPEAQIHPLCLLLSCWSNHFNIKADTPLPSRQKRGLEFEHFL